MNVIPINQIALSSSYRLGIPPWLVQCTSVGPNSRARYLPLVIPIIFYGPNVSAPTAPPSNVSATTGLPQVSP